MVILNVDVKRCELLLRQSLVGDRSVAEIGEHAALLAKQPSQQDEPAAHAPTVGGKAPELNVPPETA